MTTRFLTKSIRFCSTVASESGRFSEEEVEAILELKRRAERSYAKSMEPVIKNREWARAPVLEASGRIPTVSWMQPSKKGQRFVDQDSVEQPVVKLRWANFEKRDCDILLPEYETMYSVEVKAVLYGIVQAIEMEETRIRMRNTNEIVVKVANGRYKASKETARFHLISRVVNRTNTKGRENQLKAKLEKQSEKGIRRLAATTMTESEFFEKFRKSIDNLKNFT